MKYHTLFTPAKPCGGILCTVLKNAKCWQDVASLYVSLLTKLGYPTLLPHACTPVFSATVCHFGHTTGPHHSTKTCQWELTKTDTVRRAAVRGMHGCSRHSISLKTLSVQRSIPLSPLWQLLAYSVLVGGAMSTPVMSQCSWKYTQGHKLLRASMQTLKWPHCQAHCSWRPSYYATVFRQQSMNPIPTVQRSPPRRQHTLVNSTAAAMQGKLTSLSEFKELHHKWGRSTQKNDKKLVSLKIKVSAHMARFLRCLKFHCWNLPLNTK